MNDQEESELKAAVWHMVNEIAKQEASGLNKQVSKGFVVSLADLVLHQLEIMATDLEAFASHGKRSVISMDDVKLCARRNESLYALISEAAKDIAEETQQNKRAKKK